jgi:hypothetical protein
VAGYAAQSYGQSDSVPAPLPPIDLENAPSTVSLGGTKLTMDAHGWVNLMPSPDIRPNVTHILSNLSIFGEKLPSNVFLSRLWVLSQNMQPREASTVRFWTTQDGLRVAATVSWPPGKAPPSLWLVAEIKDSGGNIILLRSTETVVQTVR